MTKTRSFTIFLLKDGFNATNSLKQQHDLKSNVPCNNLPPGAVLYVLDNPAYPPWWRDYFGIQQKLEQASKGALVFLPAQNRWFALSFGHVFHNLNESSYEYDFGLRITLNCVDPLKLKSTDALEPGEARRQRTQSPTAADLTFFDLDTDSAILKSLTGKVKDQYKNLFKSVTGSTSIHVSLNTTPNNLPSICEELFNLYNDQSYRTSFPEIQNISPVRDPEKIGELNDKLIEAVKNKTDHLAISLPDIVDHAAGFYGTFSGAGGALVCEDVFIGSYFEYLEKCDFDLNTINMDALRKHQLTQTDHAGQNARKSYSLSKCLIFDTTLNAATQAYHLIEGNWYQIETNYLKRLSDYLDPFCKDTTLPSHTFANEGEFNEAATTASSASRICLDRKSIAPAGQKAVEPCDVIEIENGKAVFHHIKISTTSSLLSHLFNQGLNAVRLLRDEPAAVTKLKELLAVKQDVAAKLVAAVDSSNFKVVFGIVTHKSKDFKSLNLPLFSRMSLMRGMKELKRMGIEAEYCFIKDDSQKKKGQKKPRKKKGAEP